MNTNSNKRNKNRSTLQSSHTNSSLQNINSKVQMRQKSSTDLSAPTPEGVYFNGRVMHCTTSLIGCLVQIQVKDGTKYEGVLRTFSPEFELVIDYVTKIDAIDANAIPIATNGTNIGNLLASLEANHRVSQTVIFKFQDVVKLNALNVDLDFATSKAHLLTDAEISRYDSRQLNRDKELVPWDGSGDGEDQLAELEDSHNGVTSSAQNGWDPDEMFKTNETRFQVKSTYDPNLKDYTIPLVKGEGQDYEQRQREAEKIAHEIESDSFRTDRYAKEDADDEERYSAVVRPGDSLPGRHQRNARKTNTIPATAINSGPPGQRSTRPALVTNVMASASPAFHSANKQNSNNTYSKQSNSTSIAATGSPTNTCSSYQSQTHSKGQSYRDEQLSGYALSSQSYSKADGEEPQTGPHSTAHPTQAPAPHQSQPLPQRTANENRRPMAPTKRKDEMTADLKRFSNDFKLPSSGTGAAAGAGGGGGGTGSASAVDTSKETQRDVQNECQDRSSHAAPAAQTHSGKQLMTSGISAKSKSPVNADRRESTPPVKADSKSDSVAQQSVDEQSSTEKEVRDGRDVRELTTTEPKRGTDSTGSAHSPSGAAESEIAKKSTLNPNAKTFTPRSPMTPLNPSATPPSVASTPSSTVSVPISGHHMTHQHQHQSGPHNMGHNHNQQSPMGQQSAHPSQARFQNPLMQLQPQYNVLPPGLTLPLGPNQYLMTNVAAMAPTFTQSNHNSQQRGFRSKGPQQYSSHGIRHDFSQPSAHVAAAVTGHPVLATAPIAAPQQIPVSYGQSAMTTAMVSPQAPPQHMYQHMYQQFHPRMNVLPQHSAAMQMAVPHAVQYDPSQLQHIYATGLQHLVSQAQVHQHMTNSGQHSGHSTPQSQTPTTPLHAGPAPSPVHHQPNQPPTPTPQQTVMYANVTASPHNQQNPNVGHHSSSGQTFQNIVILPNGQAMTAGHHSGHGGPLHALSHSSAQANHHSGPTALLPVQLIASSNAAQNALASASFNANAGTSIGN